MVLGMGIRFSKTIANKLGTPPSGLFAMNQILYTSVHGWNPQKIIKEIFQWILLLLGMMNNILKVYEKITTRKVSFSRCHLENDTFPVVIFWWIFRMLFIIAYSNRIHWKISFIIFWGFQPCTDVYNIWFIANRPLGGVPNLFAMVFENLIPIPNTIPRKKKLFTKCTNFPSSSPAR